MAKLAVIILAAGQGTRMQSKKQKILHEVGGRSMVAHVLEAAASIADLPPVIVVGPGDTGIQRLFGDRASYVVQPDQLGTGHATRMAEPLLNNRSDQVLVTYGDMPLLRPESMTQLARLQAQAGAAVALLTVEGEPESPFGRVVRAEAGQVLEIVEVAEARQRPKAAELLALRELNAGVYCFAADWLWANLPALPLRQARRGQEYYLTDLIGMAVNQDQSVVATPVADPDECLGAGTRSELVLVEKAFRRRAAQKWLASGVTLLDPETCYIDQTVIIGQDTIIWPNTYLQGQTVIGEDCIIGPNTIIRDAHIGPGCRIEQAQVDNIVLDAGTVVVPYSYLKG